MYKPTIFLSLTLVCTIATWGQSQNTPIIFNHSETAIAGDVIYLQGVGFGACYVQYSYNDSNWNSLTPLECSSGLTLLKIPQGELRLPDLLTIRISADHNTWSLPAFLNRARGTSIDSDQIAAGGLFRIWGRNLLLSHTPTVRFVDQSDMTQAMAQVITSQSSSFALQVTAPAAVKAGHIYSIYVSNGHFGNASSGGESLVGQSLQGRSPGVDHWNLGTPWAADLSYFSNVFNIQNDQRLTQHASGLGSPLDAGIIAKAIQTASSSGGGVIFLPAGTYNLVYGNGSCGISLKNRVSIVGAGAANTIIQYGFGTAVTQAGYAVCFGDQSGIADLALNNVNESGLWPQSGLALGNHEIFIQRVKWDIGTSQWISIVNSKWVAIENSFISQGIDSAYNYNGVLDLSGSSQTRIFGNTIVYSVGGLLLNSMSDSTFENNTVVRNISTLAPGGVTHGIEANFNKNFAALNNSFGIQGGSLPSTNDGEVFNSEGGGGQRFDEFRGVVTSSTSLTMVDASQNFLNSTNNSTPALRVGAVVAIVSGLGMGQWRVVNSVSSDGTTLTIDHAWDVQPESQSHYATFDWSASNWILAGNSMSGNNKGIEFFDASVNDVLIQSNVLTDSSGIMISPDQQESGLFNVVHGVQIIGNTIADVSGFRPAYVAIVPREDGQRTNFGTAVIGVEVRGNNVVANSPNTVITNPSFDDYKAVAGFNCYWQWQTSSSTYDTSNGIPPLLGTVFQANLAQNSQTALYLNSGASRTVFQDMVTIDVGTLSGDAVIPGAATSSFATIVSGTTSSVSIGGGGSARVRVNRTMSEGDTIRFAGPNIGELANQFQIAGVSDILTFDGEVIGGNGVVEVHANPDSISGSAGVLMVRGSLDPRSPFVSIGKMASGYLAIQFRNLFGGVAQSVTVPTVVDSWLKLSKIGSRVIVEYSTDGLNWNQYGTIMLSFQTRQYYVGLTGEAATFDHFSIQ